MSAGQHMIEYAKSGRAKCHGSCGGSLIAQGSLRYGRKIVSDTYGESTLWRHWTCSQQYLAQLSSVRLENIPGFRSLRPEDKSRVRQDVKTRRISRASQEPESPQASGSRKRKLESAPALTSTQPLQVSLDDDTNEFFDNREDEVKDELYISLPASVVGLQYYKGMVGPGEEVTLVREPHNRYDSNAIQVLNISGTQVGHVPRNIASKLAPLIDHNYVTVEGVIHEGNANQFEYSISMTLRIYGASHKRAQLEPMLIWATPRQKGFTNAMRPASYQIQPLPSSSRHSQTMHLPMAAQAGTSRSQPTTGIPTTQRRVQEDRVESLRRAAELRSILSSLEKVDDEGRRTSLLDTVCKDVLDLPLHPSPPSVASGDLTVDLLKHQNQALQWCLTRENPTLPSKESDKPVQFWQYRISPGKPKGYYLNIATKTPQETPPVLGRGGLMADAMGLGKTLTMLALIIASREDLSVGYSNSTLIVAPLSVLSNWKTQISDHCAGSLSHFVYYDSGRNVTPDHLQKFDVVITTYQVVAQDFSSSSGVTTASALDGKSKKKKKSTPGLFDVKWKRIILDEGHSVRNPKTKMATAVRNLDASLRWVVTGTPIINSPKDLGSLLQFLQLPSPLDKEDYYKRLLLRPLSQGVPEGAELLRALMSQICIRRTKEMQNNKGEHLVPLPPVEMTMIPVQLDVEARALYEEIEALSQQRVTSHMQRYGSAGGLNVPTNVLSLLTRLRQLTLHPALIPLDYLEQLRTQNEETEQPAHAIQITQQDRIRLQAILLRSIEDNDECPICFSIPSEPRITACSHVFCLPCILEVLARDPKCPMDRRVITAGDLIEPPAPTELTQIAIQPEEDEVESGIRAGSSAKIDQLVHLLQLTPKTEKSLVFSQFTGFLSKIAEALEEHGIPYVRFDGQMSARRRQEVLERFNAPLTEGLFETQGSEIPSKQCRRSSAKVIIDSDDYVVTDQSDGDDNSFLDDSGDDSVWVKKGAGKGRGKGKGKEERKKQNTVYTDHGVNPVVMLISLKAGALGLNLTVANNVYLMDPWWQEGIESQAIDRCNRIGQTKPVHVYQLVAEGTVEAKVLEIQERKKALIKQAFSGIKNAETQRQKKEARLQDLIELFGVRRNTQTQNTVA